MVSFHLFIIETYVLCYFKELVLKYRTHFYKLLQEKHLNFQKCSNISERISVFFENSFNYIPNLHRVGKLEIK